MSGGVSTWMGDCLEILRVVGFLVLSPAITRQLFLKSNLLFAVICNGARTSVITLCAVQFHSRLTFVTSKTQFSSQRGAQTRQIKPIQSPENNAMECPWQWQTHTHNKEECPNLIFCMSRNLVFLSRGTQTELHAQIEPICNKR